MTFLVKRTFSISYYSTLMLCKPPEITYLKSMGITEVTKLRYFKFENYLLSKINLEVYLPYKNYGINNDRTQFFTFLYFPEDIKYC